MRMGNKHSSAGSPIVSRNGSRKSCPAKFTAETVSLSSDHSPSPPQSAPPVRMKKSIEDLSIQPVQLTMYQKAILREAWRRISKKGSGNIGSLIFRRMMAKSGEIKKLFQHITGVEGVFSFGLTPIKVYRHHSVLFVKVLDSAIASLDDLRPFAIECIEYGEKHCPYRKYGFSPDMWDVFGQCMTEAAREWEGWKKHRETLRAWTVLVSFIVDRMRQGYENAVRKETFMKEFSSAKPRSIDDNLNEACKRSIDDLEEACKRSIDDLEEACERSIDNRLEACANRSIDNRLEACLQRSINDHLDSACAHQSIDNDLNSIADGKKDDVLREKDITVNDDGRTHFQKPPSTNTLLRGSPETRRRSNWTVRKTMIMTRSKSDLDMQTVQHDEST